MYPDFLINERSDANGFCTTGSVIVDGNHISSRGIVSASFVFNNGINTFTIGPGTFIMGWCDPTDTGRNILVDITLGSYSINGYYKNATRLLKNWEQFCFIEGDVLTFGCKDEQLTINDNVLSFGSKNQQLNDNVLYKIPCLKEWRVFCLMYDGNISYC